MRPLPRFLSLVLAFCGGIAAFGIANFLITAESLSLSILFGGVALATFGGLVLAGGWTRPDHTYQVANVAGGEGYIMTYGKLTPVSPDQPRRVYTPSGLPSTKRIAKTKRNWIASSFGLATLVGGLTMVAVGFFVSLI